MSKKHQKEQKNGEDLYGKDKNKSIFENDREGADVERLSGMEEVDDQTTG